jgi:hypothetical protein
VKDFIATCLASHNSLFQAILHKKITLQEGLLLLRLAALPRIGYLARVLDPSTYEPLFLGFDELMLGTLKKKLNLEVLNSESAISQAALEQIHLPLKYGGLGITRTAAQQPVAYFSSVMASAPVLDCNERAHECAIFKSNKATYAELKVLHPKVPKLYIQEDDDLPLQH